MMTKCSPREHPHADQPNFTVDDYLQMCRDGEAEFTITEFARLAGVSRQWCYRAKLIAEAFSGSEDELYAVSDELVAQGKHSITALADEGKRRLGRAREYVERCPHCGGALRTRVR